MRIRQSGIYRIKNIINNKFYIGSSVDIKRRFYDHKSMLNKNQHQSPYLQYSWNKYGENNFIFEFIEECQANRKTLAEREQHYIDELQPQYNYLKVAYSVLGYHHTDEAKKKISKAHKGKEFSEEYRQKLSDAAIGKPKSEEHKQKLSKHFKGRSNVALIGRKHSNETKKKISEAGLNRLVSEETRSKMSQKRKGKPKSEEWKRKIAESVKRNWDTKNVTRHH